jgi:hypothetical protein
LRVHAAALRLNAASSTIDRQMLKLEAESQRRCSNGFPTASSSHQPAWRWHVLVALQDLEQPTRPASKSTRPLPERSISLAGVSSCARMSPMWPT